MSGQKRGAERAVGRDLFPALAQHQTLEGSAYHDIRRAIVGGRFAPGQRIVAAAVAAAAGVSRIPVMQALRRLEADGFVRITPHKHVVVTGLSPAEFRERFLLMAAARAQQDTARAVQADSEFHRLLWEVSGLPQVIQILQNVWDRGEYYRVIMHARRGGFAKESPAEHGQILKALDAGDPARAAKAMEHHRMRAMQRLRQTT